MDFKNIFNKAKESLNLYLQTNLDKIIYKDNHNTILKHFFNTNKKEFIEQFYIYFGDAAIKSIIEYDELRFPLTSSLCKCYNCGELITLILDNNEILNKDENLKCFNKKEYSFDINIPSGKFILCDWPKYGKDILNIEDEDVNTLFGKYKQSKNFADKNVMHFFVGNTSPSVSQKDNIIYLESSGYNEETDEEIFYDNTADIKGSICTDLWWATGIDLDLYNKLLKDKFGESIFETEEYKKYIKNELILDVIPGAYKCTTYYELYNNDDLDDCEKSKLFIKIEKQ